jgi:glycerol kinase
LMNNLGFAEKSEDITKLAESVEDNGGVVFVTAFSGLFAPYWIDDVKGTLRESLSIQCFYLSMHISIHTLIELTTLM